MAYNDLWARRLRERQAKLGKKNPDMVAATGIPTRTYSNYPRGEREPDFDTLLKICRVLRTTPNYILLEDEPEPLSPAEIRLVEIYRNLTDEQRSTFERVVSSFRAESPLSPSSRQPPLTLDAAPEAPATPKKRIA